MSFPEITCPFPHRSFEFVSPFILNDATSCEHKNVVIRSDKPLKLKLANAGGYVGILTKVEK